MEIIDRIVNSKFLWFFLGALNLAAAIITVLTNGSVWLLLGNGFFMGLSIYYFTKASNAEK